MWFLHDGTGWTVCCWAHGELAWLFLEPDTGLDHCPRILLSYFRGRTSRFIPLPCLILGLLELRVLWQGSIWRRRRVRSGWKSLCNCHARREGAEESCPSACPEAPDRYLRFPILKAIAHLNCNNGMAFEEAIKG